MLSLSQSVGYAVRALACMEGGLCETKFTRDIAACSGVPSAYLAKIFKRLVDAGILESKRGWSGGTQLARAPKEISLFEIASALEGENFLKGCLLGEAYDSDEQACPTYDFWKAEQTRIEKELRSKSLAQVIAFAKARMTSKKGAQRAASIPPEPLNR